jgi:hypothetical protein
LKEDEKLQTNNRCDLLAAAAKKKSSYKQPKNKRNQNVINKFSVKDENEANAKKFEIVKKLFF